MARMDMSTSVTKIRRSIPRILSSSKKNTQLSPLHTNQVIKDEVDISEWSTRPNYSPKKDEILQIPEQITKELDEKPKSIPVESKKVEFDEFKTEPQGTMEVKVNKVATVRRVPSLHVAPRSLRCAFSTSTLSEETDGTKSLTPNELLLALVNYFAPPMEVEETPPLLERELTPLENNYAISNDDMALESGISYSSDLSAEANVQSVSMSSTANHISPSSDEASPHPVARLGHTSNAVSDGISTPSKYPTLTLGGAIGIRKPRSSTSQAVNNNLTLDQLNPTLAEALAAMKAKGGAVSKSSGNVVFTSNSDNFQCRRDPLPTRMSGPVTLESLAPTNSTSPDGSASTSGHIVSFNGQTTEVPEEIHCHLCNYPMKLCLRKTKYKGEIREYAAYRCLRKGCQTFRSVRKVIEPDYPYNRKRKNDDSFEIFDACSPGTGVSSGSSGNDHSTEVNDSDVAANGTIIYVKQEMTAKHMEKMLEFDFKFFNEKPAPMHTIPKLLFGRLDMSISDMDEHLKSTQGQKKIQHIIMHFRQPTPPRCVIEAAELWEASAQEAQLQAQTFSYPAPATELSTLSSSSAPTSVSATTASITTCSPQTPHMPAQYPQLLPPPPPPLPPPLLPLPPPSTSSRTSISYSHQPHGICNRSVMCDFASCGMVTRVDAIPNQSCGMSTHSLSQDIKNQQYASEAIW